MVTRRITQPSIEPVSLAELKAHLRVTEDDQDDQILAYGLAARELLESMTWRSFLTQTWRLTMDRFPCGCIELPNPPIQGVTSITYIDSAGDERTLDPSLYQVDTESEPGRIVPAYGLVWPMTRWQASAVTVEYVAGWETAEDVPNTLRQALRMLVAYWHEQRESASEVNLSDAPMGVRSLAAMESVRVTG